MLGGLRAIVGDRVVSRFQTQKTGALFAFLASVPGKQFSRDQLAALLWPDGEPTAIRNRLNQAVSSLRRQLHPPGSDPNAVIVADHTTLGLSEFTVVTDVDEFKLLLKLAEKGDSEEEAARLLRGAVDLYHGEFLHGMTEDWALIERVALADAYYEALSKLIRMYVSLGRLSDAIETANRRLAQDPTEERSHRALIKLYMMSGRPRSALAQYAELERTLAQEGDQPSTRARKLRDEALVALSGESDSDGVFSGLDHAKGTQEQNAPQKLRTDNLPRYLMPFFGRERELSVIEHSLGQGTRLVSITGLGGTGKTRLAIEAAGSLGKRTAFLQAQPMGSWENLVERVKDSLDAEILVIDEAEVLSPEALIGLKQTLDENPDLVVIAASRVPLGIAGEHMLHLATLPVPTESSLEAVARNPAIKLFVNRAQAARQDFQLTERTASPISELCRKLEGWPLALELAASWARSMTASQMLEQISQHYDRLASRRRDISPKQRSLRAVIDGTFTRISASSREALGRMTVFAESWDHAGASAVCPGVDLHAILAELEESSLVVAFQVGRTMRFRMLAPVRQYVEEATGSDIVAQASFLHAEHYLKLASDFARSSAPNFLALQLDHDNFLVALKYWHAQGALSESTQLASDLGIYWDLGERISEGRQWMSMIAPLAVQAGDSEYGLFLTRLARLHWHANDLDQASLLIDEASERFRKADDLERFLEATLVTAHLAHRLGDYHRSEQALRENIDLAVNLGDSRIEARSWLALGNTLVELSRYDDAQAAYEACLGIGRRINNAYLCASATGNLGNLFLLQRSFEAANAWLEDAQRLMCESGMDALSIDIRVTRARLERLRGNVKQAQEFLEEAVTLGIEVPYVMSLALAEGAHLMSLQGDHVTAAQVLGYVQHERWKTQSASFGVEGQLFEEEAKVIEAAIGENAYRDQVLAGKRLLQDEALKFIREGLRRSNTHEPVQFGSE